MENNKDIIFRRVHGRLVPIKVNKSHIRKKTVSKAPSKARASTKFSDNASGFATIAAGIGLTLGGSFAAGKLLKSAVKQGAKIKSFTGSAALAHVGAQAGTKNADKIAAIMLRAGSRRTPKFKRTMLSSKLLLGISTGVIGSTVLESGLSKVLKKRGLSNEKRRLIENTGSAIALGAGLAVFKKASGLDFLKHFKGL